MAEQRQTYTLDAQTGQALTVSQDGITMPADNGFACVNDYVHAPERHFEELQWLALGMACEIDRLRSALAQHQSAGYPPCDYCGAAVDYMPWHGSGLINGIESRHIHACDNCRNRLPGREQQETVRVPVETLRHIHRDLDSCQKVIWLAGCRPHGYGFDPTYVSDAQARLKEIEALLGKEIVHA